jgi:hypothetical protein
MNVGGEHILKLVLHRMTDGKCPLKNLEKLSSQDEKVECIF